MGGWNERETEPLNQTVNRSMITVQMPHTSYLTTHAHPLLPRSELLLQHLFKKYLNKITYTESIIELRILVKKCLDEITDSQSILELRSNIDKSTLFQAFNS